LKLQTTMQILRCVTIGGYMERVEGADLRVRGPQPLAGPLPASIKTNRDELIDFVNEGGDGLWPPAPGSELREVHRIIELRPRRRAGCRRRGAERLAAMEAGGMSASLAWLVSWSVGAFFCVLAGVWFLVLTVPDKDLPLAWVLALAFGLVCIAAAAALRRLLWEAFVSPGPVSYSSLLVTSLWTLISAGIMLACSRVGAGRAARGCAVSFVACSGVSAYYFLRVL